MIPKIIHLCWFSNDPFPVEIKFAWIHGNAYYLISGKTLDVSRCQSIGCRFINEALEAKMGFCRRCRTFYAIYNEGGIYMDSDIFILKRFDHLIPEHGFVTFRK